MWKPALGLSISMLIVSLSSACSDTDGTVAEPHDLDEAERNVMVSSLQHCFRNEYPIEDTKDIEELIVVVDGDRAAGEYNCVPAYKDKRIGRFIGSLQGNTISASYDFEQEGQLATTTISISIEDQQAIVRGGPPELGLNLILARVNC